MSQTVPLIALAPRVVSWGGKLDLFGWEWPRWLSVCMLGAFLAFFPVAVGTLRGLVVGAARRRLELMHSYAAGWWRTLFKLRFPAAVPYMVPALQAGGDAVGGRRRRGGDLDRRRAAASAGLISYSQAATGDPAKVYTAVFGAAVLGLALSGLVVVARHRR